MWQDPDMWGTLRQRKWLSCCSKNASTYVRKKIEGWKLYPLIRCYQPAIPSEDSQKPQRDSGWQLNDIQHFLTKRAAITEHHKKGSLNNRNHCLGVLNTRSLRSRCQQSWFLFSRRPRVENALPPAKSNFARFLTAVCIEMTNERALCCQWNFHTGHCRCYSPGPNPAYLHTGCHPKSPRPGDFRDVIRHWASSLSSRNLGFEAGFHFKQVLGRCSVPKSTRVFPIGSRWERMDIWMPWY